MLFRSLVGPSDAGTTVGPLVADTVRGLCSRYRCQGVVFNPIHFGPEALELGREGIPLWRREGATDAGFKEVDELMVPASRTLLTALADGGVRHSGDHDVRLQVLLLEAVVRRNAWRVTRPGPDRYGEGRRAEAGVALVMALHAAEGSAPAQPWAAAW